MHTCGVILSGGKSSRMGKTKALLPLRDKPVIEHIASELKHVCDEVIVITNQPQDYEFLGLSHFEDRYRQKGPLGGIESALYHVNADVYVMAACDMPFISRHVYTHLMQQLKSHDAAVPMYDARMHPLAGVYRKTVLPAIQDKLDHDERKVNSFFDRTDVNVVHDFGEIPEELLNKHFFNMNNPDHYEQAKVL